MQTIRTMIDRFGPVVVEYSDTGKVMRVLNSTGRDIYWLLDSGERAALTA
jgi:hypothetical protein